MGKERIIAETGAGQHGVATATACALFGLRCIVYMGEEDVRRQSLNVYRMHLLGAEVRPVTSGTRTLKDAGNEALRDWVTNVRDTHYILGSAVGPDPYPRMVRDFQSVIGREARAQLLEVAGRLPAAVVACVGGGSNAIGTFHPFVQDAGVELVGVEAAGEGIDTPRHAAHADAGNAGRVPGLATRTCCRTRAGQVAHAHSVSRRPGLPGRGPGALAPQGQRPRHLRRRERRRGAGGVRAAGPAGGDHPRAGERRTPSRTCCARAPAGRTAAPCWCA